MSLYNIADVAGIYILNEEDTIKARNDIVSVDGDTPLEITVVFMSLEIKPLVLKKGYFSEEQIVNFARQIISHDPNPDLEIRCLPVIYSRILEVRETSEEDRKIVAEVMEFFNIQKPETYTQNADTVNKSNSKIIGIVMAIFAVVVIVTVGFVFSCLYCPAAAVAIGAVAIPLLLFPPFVYIFGTL